MPFLLSKKYIKALLIGMLAFPSSPILAETVAPEISFFEQSYSLKLKFKNETLGDAIEKLSQQAGVRIIYSNDQVQTQKKLMPTYKQLISKRLYELSWAMVMYLNRKTITFLSPKPKIQRHLK